MGAFIDLTGQRFGSLLVICKSPESSPKRIKWTCQCDCGNVTNKPCAHSLRSGKTHSCGCVGKARIGKDTRKYPNNEREVFKKEWQAWLGMRRRCEDTTSDDYADYMLRGIQVCDEWKDDFLAFLNHIGPAPKDGQRWSVGRIDNNLGYQPENVEWQLDTTQARNHTLQRNNTSGTAGVTLSRSGHKYGHDYYLAYWNELDGKKSKCFCTGKYGEDEAKRLAILHRQEQIERLNKEGAGYADTHGQPK